MQIDWIGEWFGIIEESGENIDLFCGRFDADAKTVTWSRMSHRDFDGLGALMEVFERIGGTMHALPTYQGRKIGFLDHVRAFWRYSKNRPALGRTREDTGEALGRSAGAAWTVYSREATAHLDKRAKEEKVSSNIYLLHCLHRAVVSLDLTSNEVPAWLVPINLRGAVRLENPKANHSTFLTLSIPKDASPTALNGLLRQQLKDHAHFGAWTAMNLGRVIGIERYRKRTRTLMQKPFAWTGAFSNLGVWPSPILTLPETALAPWIGCPPVSKKVPISAGGIFWNGHFALGSQIHPCLVGQRETARELVRVFNEIALSGFQGEGRDVEVGFTPWRELENATKWEPTGKGARESRDRASA